MTAVPGHAGIYFIVCLMLLGVSVLSCGRRGDPVPIEPKIDRAPEPETVLTKEPEQPAVIQENIATPEVPQAPTGLVGVYTESEIVLVWDEVAGKNIRYRVYRSDGTGFISAGETVTPAFTDRSVRPGNRYFYRVHALSMDEGPPSKEIIIVTEGH